MLSNISNFAAKKIVIGTMLTKNRIPYRKNGLFDLSDSDKLADILNHDIMKLKLMEIAEITHYYDCFFIEEVLNKVESLSDIDRFIGIIKTHWELDVYDHRELVTKYDTSTREYVPYVPDLKNKLDSIRDRISHKRELKQKLDKQWEEWEVEHQSPATKTEVPQFRSTSPEIQIEVGLKIKDLDINVQGILNITNDENFAELVDICRHEILPWLNKVNPNNPQKRCRPKKDANAVRFAFRLFGIVDKDCSVHNFVLLFNQVAPQEEPLIDDTVSSREDANMKSRDFNKYDKLPNYIPLKKDTEQLREMLQPVIDKLV